MRIRVLQRRGQRHPVIASTTSSGPQRLSADATGEMVPAVMSPPNFTLYFLFTKGF